MGNIYLWVLSYHPIRPDNIESVTEIVMKWLISRKYITNPNTQTEQKKRSLLHKWILSFATDPVDRVGIEEELDNDEWL